MFKTCFIIVRKVIVHGVLGETSFVMCQSKSEALNYALGTRNSPLVEEPTKVTRIMELGERGKVTHYKLVVNGYELNLEPISEEEK